MSRLLTVASREFRHTVLTKAFFVGAVVIPVLIVLVSIGAEVFLKPDIPPLQGRLVVIGGSPELMETLDAELRPDHKAPASLIPEGSTPEEIIEQAMTQSMAMKQQSGRPDTSELTLSTADRSADLDAIKAEIRSGDAAGLVVIDEGTLEPDVEGGGQLSIWVAPKAPPSHMELLTDSLRQSIVDTRLGQLGLSPDAVRTAMRRPRAGTIRLGSEGGEKKESEFARFAIPMGFMMLLWVVTFTGGNYLLMSTIEEKSTRAMEVLLSAVSPTALLTGKIIGFAAVSLVMLGMYLVVAAVVMTIFASLDLVSPGDLALAAVFFALAYLMVAAIMAGIGSAVSDVTEAQSLMGPAMVILILPMLLMTVVTEDPNGTIAIVGSLVPPVSPFVMVLRIAASPEPIPLLELVAETLWCMLCALGMIWAAARIFRVGVLMQGKPPSPIELLRWIRYR